MVIFRSCVSLPEGIPSQVTIEHMVSEEGYEEQWNEGDEWNEIWIHTHISFLSTPYYLLFKSHIVYVAKTTNVSIPSVSPIIRFMYQTKSHLCNFHICLLLKLSETHHFYPLVVQTSNRESPF